MKQYLIGSFVFMSLALTPMTAHAGLPGLTPPNAPTTPDPNDPNNLGDSIDQDTNQMVDNTNAAYAGFWGLNGGNGNGFGNNRRITPAEALYLRLQAERALWDIQRQALDYKIAQATADKKIRYLNEKAEAAYLRAKSELEFFKTLARQRKFSQNMEVQKVVLETEFAYRAVKRKYELFLKVVKQEAEDQVAAQSYRALEYCMQRPLQKDYLVQGKAIDAFFLVLKNSQLYGATCKNRPGHFFTDKEFNEMKYQLAIAPDYQDHLGRYLIPLLQLNPKVQESLSDILDVPSRLEMLNQVIQIQAGLQAFYRLEPKQYLQRQDELRWIVPSLNKIISLLRQYQNKAGVEKQGSLVSKLEALEKEIPSNTEEESKLESKKSYLQMQYTRSVFAAEDLVYYVEALKTDVENVLKVSSYFCEALEGTFGAYPNPGWMLERKNILACGYLKQPRIMNLNSPENLSEIPRLRLCPSRELLVEHIMNGEVFSMNDQCFSPKQESSYVLHPTYNKMCTMYHQLEGCAETTNVKSRANEANLFDHYAEHREIAKKAQERFSSTTPKIGVESSSVPKAARP